MKELLILLSLISTLKTNIPSKTELTVDVTEMSITEIQESIDEGYLTYEELMQIYLDRIDKYNSKYNAVLYINPNALEEAKEKDKEYKKNGRKSDLYGMPILVKDNIDVKGMPTTAGAKGLKDNYPKENAPAIQNLIDRGAIIIGKANMSEFALSAYNSYSSFGNVKNAYNLNYSSYGSSGGTAVGVAANFAVAGLGTDTGGSVRLPSAANDLVGLRPTWGSISSDGVIKYDKTRDTIGPITRYVEDNAILLDALTGKDNYKKEVKTKKNLKGVRVGVATQFMSNTDSSIYKLMQKAISNFKDLGAEIVYISDFYNGYYSFNDKSFCYDFNEYLKGTKGSIRSWQQLKSGIDYVNNMSWVDKSWCDTDYTKSTAYLNTLTARNSFTEYVKNKFTKYDVDIVIYPTIRNRLLTVSSSRSSSAKTYAYTITATGFPSMNLQIGKVNGLSYGMEIVTTANNEKVLYPIAYLYEQKTNYYNNPSISKNLYSVSKELTKLKEKIKTSKEEKLNKLTNSYLKKYSSNTKSNLEESILLSLYELKEKNAGK